MKVLSLVGIDLDMPVWLLIMLGLLVAYYVYMTWKYDTFKKLNIKGPRPLPIFGNLLQFFKQGFDLDGEVLKEYGHPAGIFIGREPSMIISDPEILKAIFVKEFDHFMDRINRDLKSKPLNKTLTLIRGSEWRHLRNTLTPTFSTGKLKVMLKLTNECADQLLENLHKYAEKDSAFEFAELSGAYTMDVIARTAFGYEINSQKDPNNKFIVMAKKIMNVGFNSPFMLVLFLFPFMTGILTRLKLISLMPKDALNFFLDFTKQAYQERIKEGAKQHVDFLQLMVNAHEMEVEPDEDDGGFGTESKTRKKLTEEEILANGLTFFLAGYDTTANTMSFVGYYLAANTDIQDKVIAEIDEVIGDRKPNYEDLYKMSYMEQVISEALRMHPQGEILTRATSKEITIKGVYFPKNMTVRIPVKYLHYNPDIYPNPEKFDPERFSLEQRAQRDQYHYMPFGLGPRMCLGNRLALMEIKIAFITILQQFKLATCAETEIPIKVQKMRMKPDGKLMLKVIKRL